MYHCRLIAPGRRQVRARSPSAWFAHLRDILGHQPVRAAVGGGDLQHQRRDQGLWIVPQIGQHAFEHRLLQAVFHRRPFGHAADAQVAAVFEFGKHAATDAAGMQLLAVAHALHDRRAILARDGVVGDLDEVGLAHRTTIAICATACTARMRGMWPGSARSAQASPLHASALRRLEDSASACTTRSPRQPVRHCDGAG